MHRELRMKHLFVGAFLSIIVWLLSVIFLQSEVLSFWAYIFFGLLGAFLFLLAYAALLHKRSKARDLASKELLLVSVLVFIVGYFTKSSFGYFLYFLGVLTFLFSLTTLHKEKTVKKKK